MSSRASLNHVYRTVWNQALGAMVAVAEVASGHQGRGGSSSTARASLSLHPSGGPVLGQLALGVALACWLGPAAWANPTGGVAVVGQATMTTNGSKLTVTTQNAVGTNYSAIDWKTFSIPAGSQTRIDQPNAASFSINRVVTNAPTEIYGTLSSNGRVVLVNQAGIAVSAGAVVDTAGFTASALAISDQDVLAGRLRFGGTGVAPAVGALQVQGNIIARGGDVVLVAPSIEVAKSAVVESSGGSVLLAAGQRVELTGRGLEGISMQLQAPTDSALNLGTLKGDAVGIFAGTLKHSGLIQATTADMDGGKVVLQASGEALLEGRGKIIASSATGQGGSISVLGNHVGLLDSASLDASGAAGGGTILVGGDYQGKNAAVPNANMTFVGADATLSASATDSGNGGKVIVWADDTTRMFGKIDVRGGEVGGNGGFVEASGKKYLDFQGVTDTRAPFGDPGKLLLDPDTITIDNSATNLGGGTFNVSTTTIFSGATSNPTLTWATINAQSGIVEIQSSPGASTGFGDIIFLASGAVTGPSTLSFLANKGIIINPNVVISGGAANLNFLAGWTSGTSVSSGAGNDITLFNGSQISTTGGVWMDAGNAISGAASSVITANKLTVGNVSGNSLIGGVSLTGPNLVDVFSAGMHPNAANLTFTNAKALDVGTGLVGVNGVLASGASGQINIATTAGNLTVSQPIVSDSLGGAPITLSSANQLAVNAGITSTFNASAGGLVKLVAGSGGITSTGTGIVNNLGALEIQSAGGVNLSAANTIATVAANVTGAGQSVAVVNTNSMIIGTAGSTAGVSTNNGIIQLTADSIDLIKPVNAGTSRVSLISSSTGSAVPMQQSGTGVITAGQLEVSVPDTTGPVDLLLANQVGVVAIGAKGQITFKNASPSGLSVGTVGATTGITSLTEGIEIEQSCGCAVTISQPIIAPAGKLVKIKAGNGALLTTGSGKVKADQIDLQVNAGTTPGAVGGPGLPFTTEDYGSGVVINIGDTNGGVAGVYMSHTGSLDFGSGSLYAAPNAAVTLTATGNVNLPAVDTGTSDLWLESTLGSVVSPTGGSFKGHNISLLSHTGIDIDGDIEATGGFYLGVASTGAVTQNADGSGVIKVAGTTTYAGLSSNNVDLKGTFSGPTNEFTGAVSIPAASGVVTLKNEGNLVVGNIAGVSLLLSSANGSIVQTAGSVVTSDSLSVAAKNGIVLGQANAIKGVLATNSGTGASGNIELNSTVNLTVNTNLSNSAASSGGNILLKTTGNLTLSGNVSSTNGTGDAIVLVAGGNFSESGGLVSVPGGARWLIYSVDPLTNTINPTGDVATNSLFQQYGATYGVSTVLGSGNGLLYSAVPSAGATTSLTGTVSKVYDGTTTAPLTISNYSVSPVTAPVWGGTSTSVVVSVPGIGTFSDPNVGTAKLVSSTGGSAYALFPGSKTVYGIPLASASGNIGAITGLSLILGSLTGSVTKAYDGNNSAVLQASNYALTGFIGSDGATVGNVVGTYSTKSVGSGLLVTANLLPSDFTPIGTTNFANYTLPTVVSGSIGTITPKLLGVSSISTENKIYDGTTRASLSGGVLSGVVAGDLVSIGALAGSFVDKGVGVRKPVNVSTVSLLGANANNYSVDQATVTTSADITPKLVNVGELVADNKVYDGNFLATFAGNRLVDAVVGDEVVAAATSATFSDKKAGFGKAVTLSGLQLTGADANNYKLSQPSVVLQADITPKPILVTDLTAVNRIYDGTTVASANLSTTVLSGKVPGDDVAIASISGVFDDKNVGLNKAVLFDSVTLNGVDAPNYKATLVQQQATANIVARDLSQWIGVSGGLWSDPANWDAIPDGNNVLAVNVPAGRGAVIIDASAGAINLQSLTSSSGFVITGGSIQVANNFTSNGYVQSGGSVSGAGAFDVKGNFSQTSGNLSFGSVSVVQTTGDLNFANITAPTVSLTATSGAIRESGALVATKAVTTTSTAGTFLNNTGNRIAEFGATNTGTGNIELVNTGVLPIVRITNTGGGSIIVSNTGGITTQELISAPGGSISLTANSPLTIGTGGVFAQGNVNLVATNLTSSGNMTLNGPIESGSGAVNLNAGNDLTQNSSILAPLGVSATAGGTLTVGPQATTGYQPVSYIVNNVPVSPPRSPSSNNVATDQIVSLMQSSPILTNSREIAPVDTLLGKDKERDLSKELIVSEGQVCRP